MFYQFGHLHITKLYVETHINLNVYNLRLEDGKCYKTLFMQLFKTICKNWVYINSCYCMVCPTTVSLIILSSRSKTSSSNFFFFNFRLSCFKMRVLNCCSSTRSCVIYFLFCLHFPSDSCTTIKRFSFSTSWVDTAVADCGCSLHDLWDYNYITPTATQLFWLTDLWK